MPMNPATSNKTSPEYLSKLLKGANRTFFQAVKPSHCHRPYTGWEHFAYQGLILGVNSHSLVEMANVLHMVRFAITHGECWLSKPPRKFSPFNLYA